MKTGERPQDPNERPVGRSVKQFCRATGLGRTTIYTLLSRGDLEAVKVGQRMLIITDPEQYLASMPRAVITCYA